MQIQVKTMLEERLVILRLTFEEVHPDDILEPEAYIPWLKSFKRCNLHINSGCTHNELHARETVCRGAIFVCKEY